MYDSPREDEEKDDQLDGLHVFRFVNEKFRVAKAVVHVYYVELIERCWPIRYDFISLNFSSKHRLCFSFLFEG